MRLYAIRESSSLNPIWEKPRDSDGICEEIFDTTNGCINLPKKERDAHFHERYYLMSGETLEDYFRDLNLDETRRKYLEDIKEGKQVDMMIQEQFKNGNVQQH